jgi:hypothetical protein
MLGGYGGNVIGCGRCGGLAASACLAWLACSAWRAWEVSADWAAAVATEAAVRADMAWAVLAAQGSASGAVSSIKAKRLA